MANESIYRKLSPEWQTDNLPQQQVLSALFYETRVLCRTFQESVHDISQNLVAVWSEHYVHIRLIQHVKSHKLRLRE